MFRLPFALMLLAASCIAASAKTTDRPNVVVFLTDDQGWGDLSLNGNENLRTPRIDSLARDGAKMDRFYVCPVCSPTRAEFLTGRYHARSGVYSTSAGGERMNLDEVTIADTFRAAGYRTAAFGKWHNGMQFPYHPNGRGFDEYYGFCSGHWGDYFSPPLEHNGQIVQGEGFCIDDFTNHAIAFAKEAVSAQQPFFAYVPYNTPHSPMQVPDSYWDRFKDKNLSMRHREPKKENIEHSRCALAMCENIDWNVGRMLDALEEMNVADNTIVIYFCDNGPNGSRWNGGMKGRKGSTDEGGVRSPLLVRWPNGIPAGRTITEIGAAIDLLPTLAELCDVPLISEKPLDGKSIAPLLSGSADEWPERHLISQWRGKISVRNQRYRLGYQGGLFDIVRDPQQRSNIAAQHPALVKTMTKVATDYAAEVKGYDKDERPFLLGHAEYKFTQIPARDALVTGGIQRSNRFPNCSYFHSWNNVQDKIYWPVTVAASGKYEVQLQYACPAADVGSEIELSFGDSRLTKVIDQPHDPPARGGEHDRVPRAESYVKDFRTMSLGTIDLEAGAGTLTLSANSMPGSQVMEFRLLFFTKVD